MASSLASTPPLAKYLASTGSFTQKIGFLPLIPTSQIKRRGIKPSKISRRSSQIQNVLTSPVMNWTSYGREYFTVRFIYEKMPKIAVF
jgi:hypothetical protein